MQNIISIYDSFNDQSHYDLASQIRFLNQKIRDLETQIEQLSQTHFTIPMINGNEVIRIDEMVYCQASSNYTNIYLMDGRKVCVSKTLKYIQSLLPDQKFIRTHQSHLVNIQYIRKYQLGNRPHVQLKTLETLPISKTGAKRVQEMFSVDFKKKPNLLEEDHTTSYQLKVMKN